MTFVYSNDLVGKKESVVDEILLLNPHQTPLINLVGFSDPVISTTHVWYEDEMFDVKSTVTAAATASDTEIFVADVEPFRPGAIVQVDEEMMLVTAVDTGAKKLTVQRGYSGSEPADIEQGAEIEVLFLQTEEGAAARESRYKPRNRVENYTQIFSDTIEVTGTAQSIAQYGVSDLYNYERSKKELELALQLEKALINGLKLDDGRVRQMRGIRSFIQTNVMDANKSAISVDMLNDIAQMIYVKGGFASGANYVIMVPAKQKRAISELSQDKIRLVQSDTRRGQVVDYLVNDFGEFQIVLNNNLKPDELFFIDINRVYIRPLADRAFYHELLGKDGDRIRGTIVGEYTLEFRQEAAHARIKNLA
jgi:hypothetical protein